jgi:hypothetical protein
MTKRRYSKPRSVRQGRKVRNYRKTRKIKKKRKSLKIKKSRKTRNIRKLRGAAAAAPDSNITATIRFVANRSIYTEVAVRKETSIEEFIDKIKTNLQDHLIVAYDTEKPSSDIMNKIDARKFILANYDKQFSQQSQWRFNAIDNTCQKNLPSLADQPDQGGGVWGGDDALSKVGLPDKITLYLILMNEQHQR